MSDTGFDLKGYAERLPAPVPGPALRDRIVALHAARRARRRSVAGALGVLALVALAGALMPREVASPGPDRVAAAAELRAADRALQAAYERGADDVELTLLWSRRDALRRGETAPLPVAL